MPFGCYPITPGVSQQPATSEKLLGNMANSGCSGFSQAHCSKRRGSPPGAPVANAREAPVARRDLVGAQYSFGSDTIVRSLGASVMTYNRCPLQF